jgi:D-glycero-alpha-D-manno-heptose 1-phosphate guanylyltransferase
MTREIIILAGGKGTRLSSVVADVPKPMANVAGKPFLFYLLKKIKKQNFERVILSVGYKSEVIINYFGHNFEGLELVYAHEEAPLGTGGGLKLALSLAVSSHVMVMNGDTFFDIDYQKLLFLYQKNNFPPIAFAVFNIEENTRYGGIELDDTLRIVDFGSDTKNSFINSGLYVINKSEFLKNTEHLHEVFSLEDDFFKKEFQRIAFIGVPYINHYFLDIGIPEDYQKAQIEIPERFEKTNFNTLFLDRDGVINKKIDNGYVLQLSDFELIEGSVDSISALNACFLHTIVITNQRCVGKGLLSEATLQDIHTHLCHSVETAGGKIDAIYYCPDVDESSPKRKPNAGMFFDAQNHFENLALNATSVMIGDSLTDLIPAKQLNLKTVYISKKDISLKECLLADYVFESLADVSVQYFK